MEERLTEKRAGDAEDELNSLRARLAERDRQLAQSGRDLRRLSRWIEQLYYDIELILTSRRWKTGDFIIGRILKRLLFSRDRAKPWAPDHAREVIGRFNDWNSKEKRIPISLFESESESPANDDRFINQPAAEIIVCVHDALEDVKACLASVAAHTAARHKITIVNDGSGESTTRCLRDFVKANPRFDRIEILPGIGYTRAANRALRESKSEYAVLLNSDTIVTPSWIEMIIECGQSDPRIGLVGPLSNSGAWQSVPRVLETNGDWCYNDLPDEYAPHDMAKLIERISKKEFPRVPLVSGFCFAVKRSVIEKIGFLDEELFPAGYGEEDDYCLRARNAGFAAAVADHAYVYHSGSASFGNRRRWELSREGWRKLGEKHGRELVLQLAREMENNAVLGNLRKRLEAELAANAK